MQLSGKNTFYINHTKIMKKEWQIQRQKGVFQTKSNLAGTVHQVQNIIDIRVTSHLVNSLISPAGPLFV